MQNDLVEAVRDGMISTLILTRKHLTVDDVDDLARAAIQTTAEHFAGVAEGAIIMCSFCKPSEGPFTRQDRTVDEARAQIAAAIRASAHRWSQRHEK